MLVNKISNINNINFTAFNEKKDSSSAILMLRDANASIRFQQSQEFAKNADSVTTNPIKALGYKLYRTFSLICDGDDNVEKKSQDSLNKIA